MTVDMSKLTMTARIEGTTNPTVRVTFDAPGLDRKDGYAWSCGSAKTAPALAARLKRAVEAGAVLEIKGVLTDVDGNTYVSTRSRILGRTMNADLRRMGF